jgi:hypothetical protein
LYRIVLTEKHVQLAKQIHKENIPEVAHYLLLSSYLAPPPLPLNIHKKDEERGRGGSGSGGQTHRRRQQKPRVSFNISPSRKGEKKLQYISLFTHVGVQKFI